jgi:hypothetical protein
MKGMTATRKIFQTTVSKIKNAVLGVPGTAFFHFLSQDIMAVARRPVSPPDPGALFLEKGPDGVACIYAIERIGGNGADADPVNLYG